MLARALFPARVNVVLCDRATFIALGSTLPSVSEVLALLREASYERRKHEQVDSRTTAVRQIVWQTDRASKSWSSWDYGALGERLEFNKRHEFIELGRRRDAWSRIRILL